LHRKPTKVAQLQLVPPVAQSNRPEKHQRDIPDGHKSCNLCANVLPQSEFKLKYDGHHCSYCNACDKLVGRGRRRGLSMEAMRNAFQSGALLDLLDKQPIVGCAAGSPALKSSMTTKVCNLCKQELMVSRFRTVSGGRVGAYCVECDRLVGRGRRCVDERFSCLYSLLHAFRHRHSVLFLIRPRTYECCEARASPAIAIATRTSRHHMHTAFNAMTLNVEALVNSCSPGRVRSRMRVHACAFVAGTSMTTCTLC
jgi:hypothetical protein